MMKATQLFKHGFTDMVSVIPTGATLSENSTIRDDDVGKIPGKRNSSGTWSGYPWLQESCSERDAAIMDLHGASIGLKATRFPAVDIDILDEPLALALENLALQVLGPAPVRVGRAPKRLLMYRTEQPMTRRRLIAGEHLLEILGQGQQYVISGIHPKTKKPYTWSEDITQASLTTVTTEQIDAYLGQAKDLLDMMGIDARLHVTGGQGSASPAVAQENLKAPTLEALRAAVSILPNTAELFPTRDDYIQVGIACKAAGQDNPEEAFQIWWDWCDKYTGDSVNEIERARADWERMHPPHRVGYEWLAEIARAHGGLNVAQHEFTPVAEASTEVANTTAAISPAPMLLSEAELARRFVFHYGEQARYCKAMGGWMVWDGKVWVKDTYHRVRFWAGNICRQAVAEALLTIEKASEANKLAVKLGSNAVKNAVIDYASDDPRLAVNMDDFDADPWLINTQSGVVDLTTGTIRQHEPKYLQTKITNCGVGDSSFARTWLNFITNATGGDDDLALFLKRMAGYALTGSIKEHSLCFFYGAGGNGKGTFLNTLSEAMGNYAAVAPMDTFTAKRNDAHPTDLAGLVGARLVTAQETDEGRRWDEAKVKSFTGGDPISARFMRGDFFTFKPQAKLIFAGNHRPEIRNVDAAIRRRMSIVPFTITPKVVDKDLPDKLRAELPHILAWLIEGCLLWQQNGLAAPESVQDATDEYFDDEDPMGRWLDERCDVDASATSNSQELFADWQQWANENNEYVGTSKRFLSALKKRGLESWKHPVTRRRGLRGIRLKSIDFELLAPVGVKHLGAENVTH